MSQDIPYLDRVKIQAEILLPLFRRLREELGEARACELLRAAVAEYATRMGKAVGAQPGPDSLARLKRLVPAFTAGDALDLEPLADTDTDLRFNVRGCRYAQYFRELGEPLLGAILTCEIDSPLTAAIGGDLALSRTQTIMGGASHCDFHWKLDTTRPR